MRVTVKQLAEQNKLKYTEASGLMNVLVSKGHAKKVDVIPNHTGRGRGSTVFEVPEQVTINLAG